MTTKSRVGWTVVTMEGTGQRRQKKKKSLGGATYYTLRNANNRARRLPQMTNKCLTWKHVGLDTGETNLEVKERVWYGIFIHALEDARRG